jgi:1-acyl-sn-glycerol-3-phosphate acyltransferase
MNNARTYSEIAYHPETVARQPVEDACAEPIEAACKLHPLAEFLARLAKLVSGAQVRWVGCRPDTCQRIYLANHSSHLDFLVIWGSLPKNLRARTRAVGGRDYWTSSRRLRFLAEQVFQMVLIERGCHAYLRNHHAMAEPASAAIEPLVEAMEARCSLIVFPEGTRGDGDGIAPFKSGLYHLCRAKPDIELVPVYLHNLNRILPRGALLPVPTLSGITFGPPTHLRESESQREFLNRMRHVVSDLVAI